MKHVKLDTISLKNHPTLNERWLQDVIANDPGILNLGDVVLLGRELIQVGAGRLDLLLQEADENKRYEVEIQLGATDESHLVRTLEYWDIEMKRHPQFEHVAVIVAEDITSRFLNVISLFNGFIPLMAIKVTAIDTPEGVGLQFTKVLDTVKFGYANEDEVVAETTDRKYWETVRGTPQTVALTDLILEMVKDIEPNAELNYNKHYIGFLVSGRARNAAIMRPKRNSMRLEIRLPKDEVIDEIINNAELDILDYDARWKRYRIKLSKNDFTDKKEIIANLVTRAFEAAS